MFDFENAFSWQIDFSPKYKKLEKLGEGANGKVYRAQRVSDGKIVAIKYLKTLDHKSRQRFQNEIQVYQQLKNFPNIVKIYDYSLNTNEPYLVMEFSQFGTARDQISYFMNNPSKAVALLLGSARGIREIHNLGSYHRDIKPDNLLFTTNTNGNYVLKLSDAGMCCFLPDASIYNNATYSLQGTPSYIDPELLQSYSYSEKSDVFSFGVTCHELLTGVRPFPGQEVSRGPFEMRNLIQRMISTNSINRPTMQQVISEMTQAYGEIKSTQDIKDFVGGVVKAGSVVGGLLLGASLLDELLRKK